MSLRANVVAAIVTATAALILTVILLEDPLLEYRQTQQARDDMLEALGRVDEAMREGATPDEAADAVGASSASHVTVFGADGRVVGDTGLDGDELVSRGPAATGRDLDEARRTGTGVTSLGSGADERLSVALRGDGGMLLRASRPKSAIRAASRSARELLVLAGVIAGAAGLLLTLVLSRTMVRPVEDLTRAADALARGDLDLRTRSVRTDELGRLGRALDRMADQLQDRIETIRAEEARLTAMLDGMVEAVFVTDADGRIVLTNRALDGLVTGAVRGRTVVEAIRSAELHEAVVRALRGESSAVALEVDVGEEARALAAQVAPLPEHAGVVTVLHDVTELKRADRVRRDFVANASHELRTPLTAIRGYAETLKTGALEDPETAQRFVDTILRHTIRLQRLVDDLLALSRSESPDQQFELGAVRVGDVLRGALSAVEAQAQAKHIVVTTERVDGLPPVLANQWALDHVLVNLVDNAVKYTQDGGTVTVRGSSSDGAVSIEVEDNGPGIPASSRERVFERFYRVDKGRSRDQGGTGLGLAIVKHLVQRMGAEVTVESTPTRGTVFRVRLARAPDEPAVAAGA